MKSLPALLLALLLLPAVAFAQVKAEDKACQSDSDCALIQTSCTSCCPMLDANEMDAVSSGKAKTYESLGACTPEHIKGCGVPECGLFPAPYPVAVCQQGACAVTMHAASLPPAK